MGLPDAPDLSVVIPARDEARSLPGLIQEVALALAGRCAEILVVDDGSRDDTPEVVARLTEAGLPLEGLRHEQGRGKSAAVRTGVLAARAAIVATLDGDGQDDPRFLDALLAPLTEPTVGLVAGQRTGGGRPFAKAVGSRIANGLRRAVLGDGARDSACGLKAFRREAFLALPYFDGQHRFLPALFRAGGWTVTFVDVEDRARLHGRSHYGLVDRSLVGIRDLARVWWLQRRRPARRVAREQHLP